jgi:uncharacterized protein YgbK (DUF1537 family)
MDTVLLETLPPDYPDLTLHQKIRSEARTSAQKLVVLDDDPTGVQTVYDTAVLTRWSSEAIEAELRSPDPLFFILTNSRSKSAADAIELNQDVARSVLKASRRSGHDVVFVSRSDSTLRGHFPEETDVLSTLVGDVDGIILLPAFIEGGRVTIHGTHYVRDSAGLTPVCETEFAHDPSFGYRSSYLPDWVEERSGGRIKASRVLNVSIRDLREGGPDRVATLLERVADGRVVVVDAVTYRDIEVASLGILRSEARGKRFIYRCGASLVRVRAGIAERPLLSRKELLGADAGDHARGVVVVGSHVDRSTVQLERLLALPGVFGIEVSVPDVLASQDSCSATVEKARSAVEQTLRTGRTPVIFTSRNVVGGGGRSHLQVGEHVSAALIDVIKDLAWFPDFIIAKGGITSSDIGTEALGVRRAIVIGQARPGVPVWRLGPETPYCGMPYVVFPGNVGEANTLASLVAELTDASEIN